jgi:hypothetical protein
MHATLATLLRILDSSPRTRGKISHWGSQFRPYHILLSRNSNRVWLPGTMICDRAKLITQREDHYNSGNRLHNSGIRHRGAGLDHMGNIAIESIAPAERRISRNMARYDTEPQYPALLMVYSNICSYRIKSLLIPPTEWSETQGLRCPIPTQLHRIKMWVPRAMSIGLLAISTLCQTILAVPSPAGGIFARTPADMIIPRDDNGLQDVVW